MTRDFSVNHSLFVIIISRGDQYGIYGTHGERIEYWAITTRFDQVPGLKGKPKIFILDDCEIGELSNRLILIISNTKRGEYFTITLSVYLSVHQIVFNTARKFHIQKWASVGP